MHTSVHLVVYENSISLPHLLGNILRHFDVAAILPHLGGSRQSRAEPAQAGKQADDLVAPVVLSPDHHSAIDKRNEKAVSVWIASHEVLAKQHTSQSQWFVSRRLDAQSARSRNRRSSSH